MLRAAFARLIESAITVIPRALAALLVVGVFWAIAAAVRLEMRVVFRRIVDDLTIENLIKQVAYYSVWVLGYSSPRMHWASSRAWSSPAWG